jgi:hypothetical protein
MAMPQHISQRIVRREFIYLLLEEEPFVSWLNLRPQIRYVTSLSPVFSSPPMIADTKFADKAEMRVCSRKELSRAPFAV